MLVNWGEGILTMKKFKLLVTFFSAVCSITPSLASTTKPNIVMIITDEHNVRTIGAYRDLLSKEQAEIWGEGNIVETPHIDSIAKSGVLFDRMYASASVCTPSRASMFTGMYGHQLGIPNNSNKPGDGKYLKANVTTIADVLSDAGYITGYVGKWHLAEARKAKKGTNEYSFWQPYPVEDPTDSYGFTFNKYMFNTGHDKYRGIDPNGYPYTVSRGAAKKLKEVGLDKYGQPLFSDGKTNTVKFTTDFIADHTIEFIEKNKKKPFFIVASIPDPHTPDTVRAPYNTMYTNMKFSVPRTHGTTLPKGSPAWHKPDGKAPAKKVLADVSQYFGMVKNIDDNVGRIIQKLEDEGVLENTIIMFSSDHGDLYGEHTRMNKGTPHDGATKIPFVIAYGKNNQSTLIPRGTVIKEAANNTDWMPTLLSLAGVKSPKVAGRDLTPLIKGQKPADWNNVTFSKLSFIAAIDSRYKLILGGKDVPWLLDIEADPDELQNFVTDPKYKAVTKHLAKELTRFMKDYDAHSASYQVMLNKLITQ